jgi:hypothetical protein
LVERDEFYLFLLPLSHLYKNQKRKTCTTVNAKRYTSEDDFKFFIKIAKSEATERERSIYALLNEGSSIHHYFINLFYQIPGINRYFTLSAYSL